MTLILSNTSSDLPKAIASSWDADPELRTLITELVANPNCDKQFTWQNNQLRRKGKLVVGMLPRLGADIISFWHSSSQGGHSGVEATLKLYFTGRVSEPM